MGELRDEFSDIPVPCPRCGKLATSVHKTGSKIFYNHGDPKIIHKNAQEVEVTWKACEADRPRP